MHSWHLLKVYSSLRVFVAAKWQTVCLKQSWHRSCVDTNFESVTSSAHRSHVNGQGDEVRVQVVKLVAYKDLCPYAIRLFVLSISTFLLLNFSQKNLYLKERVLVMVHPLKQTKQTKATTTNPNKQKQETNITPDLFSFDPPYVNTGLETTLNKRRCRCQFEVTPDLSNLSWGRESATYNCCLFAESLSGFRQGQLRCSPVLV